MVFRLHGKTIMCLGIITISWYIYPKGDYNESQVLSFVREDAYNGIQAARIY